MCIILILMNKKLFTKNTSMFFLNHQQLLYLTSFQKLLVPMPSLEPNPQSKGFHLRFTWKFQQDFEH
jgi:hypothetical protein